VEDVLANGLGLGGVSTPMFSIDSLNLGRSNQFAQVIEATANDKSFAFEDTGLWGNSDRDFNDVVFQMKGAVGSSLLLDSVIVPEKDWRSSVVGQQLEQYTVDPLDLAGETINDARRVNLSTSGKTYRGWVGSIDADDFHSFSLGTTYEFNLSLSDLAADANLELQDLNGNIIFSSKNLGNAAESIATQLQPGAYRIRVSSAANRGTAYNLKLTGTPLFFNKQGERILAEVTTTGSEELLYPQYIESNSLIKLDDFRSGDSNLGSDPRFSNIDGRGTPIDGRGNAIVIIDSGLNRNHPFFGPDQDGPDRNGDGIGDPDEISDRIRYSFDFGGNRDNADASDDAADATDDTALSFRGHGTNVTSIAAGSGSFTDLNGNSVTYTGVAPGATIIHLKVYARGQSGYQDAAVEQALQWVLNNVQNDFNIVSVNMSFGDSTYSFVSNNQDIGNAKRDRGFSDELAAIASISEIVVVSASGNDYAMGKSSRQGVAYPSADPSSLSVGAVFDDNIGQFTAFLATANTSSADVIAPFSQRDANLTTIFAPGVNDPNIPLQFPTLTNNSNQDNFWSVMSGTSMAAPHISGMVALSQQLAQEVLGRPLTSKEFKKLLIDTGDIITDSDNGGDNVTNTGVQFRRANMLNLANKILGLAPEVNLRIPVKVVGIHQKNSDDDDQDFDKNGPRMSFSTKATINAGKIKIDGSATWEEWDEDDQEQGDTIFAASINGEFDIKKLLQEQHPDFASYEVDESVGVRGRSYENFSTIDADLHDPQTIFQDATHLVSKYKIVGDTKQGPFSFERGDRPLISLEFNPVKVQLRDGKGELLRNEKGEIDYRTYNIPAVDKYSVGWPGNGDFGGSGVKIELMTEVIPEKDKTDNKWYLVPRIKASFEGKKPNSTRIISGFQGNEPDWEFIDMARIPVDDGYTVDKVFGPQYTVDEVFGPQYTAPQDILKLTDVDLYEPQPIEKDDQFLVNQSLVGSYSLVGDQDGNDMPSAELMFNVKVKLRAPSVTKTK
jgi:subtilisin family serine protease